MIFYINKDTGTVLLAYYNRSMNVIIDYFYFFADTWENYSGHGFKTLEELRKAIIKADFCEIILDDKEP